MAEAIRILYTRDQILNSKNEYMANCLTRICVEENKLNKKKREREEEMAEEEEKQRLLAFKMKHQRPKRTRAEDLQTKGEPAGKWMRIFLAGWRPTRM